jgi:1-acyl-sn-glycerol-3-phosphate acyltransferase
MINILRGIFAIFLYTLNFIFCGAIIFLLAPFKLLPIPSCKKFINKVYRFIPNLWALMSDFTLQLSSDTQWDIRFDPQINKNESYVLIANHQSWFDIIALQKAIAKVAPSPVYIMKRALLWVPVMGWACWLLDFPFVYRFSKNYLEQHPEKRGMDLQMMRRTCERYRASPVTFINFVEGTRFQETKRLIQNSPYSHLLKPRGGGLAFTLNAMGDQIQQILNVTIVYSPASQSLWQMLCNKRKKIIVDIQCLKVSNSIRGNYQDDAEHRQQFQSWLNGVWLEKDSFIVSTTRHCEER